MLLATESWRIPRGMLEQSVSELPCVNAAATRMEWIFGTLRNGVAMLENDECVMVFPEGVRRMNEIWGERDRLQRFGTGLLRIALRPASPIVLVAIVGADERREGICA